MLIETDKYQPTSLRKGRKQALEKDLHEAYTIFSSRFTDPVLLTISDLQTFWTITQLTKIPYLRCEEQDQQQYYQVIYRILINEYFLRGDQSKKLFTIFNLYLFVCSIDAHYDRNPRPIHVTAEFIDSLRSFLRVFKEKSDFNMKDKFFVKCVFKIKQSFIYSIKTGLRDPLIKKNGETFIRYPQAPKKLSKNNYSPALQTIKDSLPSLQQSIQNYTQAKQAFLGDLMIDEKQQANIRRQFSFDKHITLRLSQNLQNYQSQFFEESME